MAEWISVKDKFPVIDEKVLAFVDGSLVIAEMISDDEWGVCYWIDCVNELYFDGHKQVQSYLQEELTHWMELPQPPATE